MAGILQEIQGDLFSCDASYSLAHCVSEDLKMGKGIAVAFREKFGCVEALKAQGRGTGSVAILKDEENGRFVYYLITKSRYYHRPTYDSLRASLVAMRDHAIANGVNTIAMPRIGCGLDKLKWTQVKAMINEIFTEEHNIAIKVFIY